ncbi:MAG: hypothetical protein WDN28_19615 [Chthoniobacter sp.]
MSTHLDPLILQKLQAFAQRRRKLIVRRGIYAAVATLLVAMMLVAFLDWAFVLPDAVRWTLSGAAYLAIVVVEWRSCWRLLLRTPGSRQLARLIEHAEPRLREDLLSAVELGDEGAGQVFDSEQFRALVQTDVAARVEKLDVEQLLPAKLLRRYAFIAAAIGVGCLVAFALTGFQFGTLMMRALLPMANFARVSKVKVKIVEPSPAEMRVAQGDTLPLIIELSGQSSNKATLETFTPSGGREVVPMTPLERDRFSATIQVGRENVFYRVRAGDALTKKYQLEAVARPAVVEFQKAYTYPGYAKLEAKTVTEENGDLAALEGSQVELHLRTNQKVREAELRIEQGKKNTVVPLVQQGDVLTAKVPIDASGIYRVHLVGAESGFENKFSPEYELRAEPDLVPQVELELPKQDLILPSNEIVDVQGSASDDFALAKVFADGEDQRWEVEGNHAGDRSGRESESRAALGFVRSRSQTRRPSDDEAGGDGFEGQPGGVASAAGDDHGSGLRDEAVAGTGFVPAIAGVAQDGASRGDGSGQAGQRCAPAIRATWRWRPAAQAGAHARLGEHRGPGAKKCGHDETVVHGAARCDAGA